MLTKAGVQPGTFRYSQQSMIHKNMTKLHQSKGQAKYSYLHTSLNKLEEKLQNSEKKQVKS